MLYWKPILFRIKIVFFLGFLVSPVLCADQIESLIDSEKKQQENWRSQDYEEGILPPQWLLGTSDSIELYSATTYSGHANNICEPLLVDELADLSNQPLPDKKNKLNLKNPRVREAITQSCLARPEDRFVAIGQKGNFPIFLRDFFIAFDPPVCPSDASYSLHASFEPPLKEEPLFYLSDAEIKGGANNYTSVTKLEKVKIGEEAYADLKDIVPFLEDYKVRGFKTEAPNAELLIQISKKKVSTDDASLRSEAVFSKGPEGMTELILERVEKSKNSGHVSIMGVLDYNHDGFVDLIVEGDHDRCPFRMVFKGTETGFQPEKIPNRPCSC